jgi:hypothetical protein
MSEDNYKGMADVIPQWDDFKKKLNKAIGVGIGRYVLGRGKPGVVFNPFRGLSDPATSYSPKNYQGIGGMSQRLRLTEDENSPPMMALKTAVTKNPLLRTMETRVETPGRPGGALPAGATGSMSWTGNGPVVRLAPLVSPTTDPGMVAIHEIVGHGSHGRVSGSTPEIRQNIVVPRLEGMATGAEKGIYGPLGLALPSGYEPIYGNRPEYRSAQDLGEQVAQHLAETGEVVPREAVVDGLFRGKNPLPAGKAPVAGNGGS